jgi:hypothetical protein
VLQVRGAFGRNLVTARERVAMSMVPEREREAEHVPETLHVLVPPRIREFATRSLALARKSRAIAMTTRSDVSLFANALNRAN